MVRAREDGQLVIVDRLKELIKVDRASVAPGGAARVRDGATTRAAWTRAATVRWADVDANGHMRNTAYSDFASDARLAFLAEHGFSLERLHELGITPVLLTEQLTYRREAKLGEELVVSVAVSALNDDASRASMEQRITKADGSTAAIVRLDCAWLALATRTLVSPPVELAEVMRCAPRARSSSGR